MTGGISFLHLEGGSSEGFDLIRFISCCRNSMDTAKKMYSVAGIVSTTH